MKPVLETGQPDRFMTQADLALDDCCTGGKLRATCEKCLNHPKNGGTRRMRMPYDGPGVYRHYKGGTYRVLGMVLNENNKQPMVLYHDTLLLKDEVFMAPPGRVWVRPLDNFNEVVNGVGGTVADGTPRFTRIG